MATNGRLWIKGNYNTFDYSKGTGGRPCTEAEWDSKQCSVPPAAIFSDSFGVLSNEWAVGYVPRSDTLLGVRRVSGNVTVNTAVVTGNLSSRLTKKYNCNEDMRNCERLVPANNNLVGFGCPGGLKANGKPNQLDKCQYYMDPNTRIYYVNRQSKKFRDALAMPGSTLPRLNPEPSPPRYDEEPKIPIFVDGVDGVTPVRSFVGLYFKQLNNARLFGGCWTGTGCSKYAVICPPPCAECNDPPPCEQGACLPGHSYPITVCGKPAVLYEIFHYYDLYNIKYSGGLENLINLQEHWEDITFRFSGTLSLLWRSQGLYVGGVPKDWIGLGITAYYRAPIRKYDFNEKLKDKPPPGTPGTFSIKRLHWSQER